jgi:hypothetical protein
MRLMLASMVFGSLGLTVVWIAFLAYELCCLVFG